MPANTDTLPSRTGTITREARRPGRPQVARPSSRRRRVAWTAAIAVCAVGTAVAVGVLTSADDPDTPTPANRAALAHQADQYVHWLESRAASIPGANRAALQHQVDQYIEWLESRAASVAGGSASSDGVVAANLPALEHQAEQYVEWLESRAASVPGG